MSRTRRRPLRGSKATDRTCRNHACPDCQKRYQPKGKKALLAYPLGQPEYGCADSREFIDLEDMAWIDEQLITDPEHGLGSHEDDWIGKW